jgi:hypothetical protein
MWIVTETVMSFIREAKVRDTPLSDPGPSKCSKILESTPNVVAAYRSFKRPCSMDAIKATLRWILNVGFVLLVGLTGLSHTAAAESSQRSIAVTIRVHNYAGVAPKTLTDAEEVATEIFREAGVETRWVDIISTTENNQISSPYYPALTSADIQLSILPSKMSGRLGLPDNVIGLGPGTDTQVIYVFDSKVETIFWWLLREQCIGRLDRKVSMAQILGHVIAHELGHLLLNTTGHSAQGIMRGEWGFADFREMTCGMLLFSPQQAEVLRANVRRRNGQRETLAHGD